MGIKRHRPEEIVTKLRQVEGFSEVLECDVPITLEEDGTYRFFGNGKVILRWKG